MIRVSITVGYTELGYIELERVSSEKDTDHYSVRFGLVDGMTVNIYQRGLTSVPNNVNVLGLLSEALKCLDTEELELSNAEGTSTDLARRLDPAMRAIQASLDRDSNH